MPHAQMIQQQPGARESSNSPARHCARARRGGGGGPAPAIVQRALVAPAQPLDGEVRASMERSLGHDFSGVRVHRDGLAAAAAAAIGARAYTVGRDVVFGAGQYAPGTIAGRALLAHELAHTRQQPARRDAEDDLRLGAREDAHERNAGEWAHASLRAPAGGGAPSAVVPMGGQLVQRQSLSESAIGLLPESYRQPARDLRDSVTESPQYFVEFFTGDLLNAIKEHWLRILGVTLAFLAAEELIAILGAAPTGISQLVAAILQIAVIVVLGYFATVETVGAVKEGMRWVNLARAANGDRARIADASRAFVRMVWHIFMAIIAIAGVRAKIKGFGAPGAAAAESTAAGEGAAGTGAAARGGAEVVDIASHPGFRPAGTPGSTTGPVASSAFEGSAARQLAPEPVPVKPPVAPPEPVPVVKPSASATVTGPKTSLGTAAATGAAVAVGTAVKSEEEPKDSDTIAYRGMTEVGGVPQIAPSARGLGVRPEDVTVVAGIVKADGKGMSLARFTPLNLPPHRRPPEWGGTGKDPVWAIPPAAFATPLKYVPDTPTHANAAAAHDMPLAAMQTALGATQPLWTKVPRPPTGP
jgi:hypothetical protein